MYETGKHSGWGHPAGCKSCRSLWQPADLNRPAVERIAPPARRPARDDMIGRDVVATTAYGYNNAGGGRFKTQNVRGQVWSEADPTMIGSRKERAYWIADGSHYYAVAAASLIDQCEAEWPSPVSGGMTDARCVEAPALVSEGMALCVTCADEVAS